MAETYILNAEPRDLTGRKVRRLRAAGRVPVVLYGHGIKSQSLSVGRGELEKVFRQAGGSAVVTVKLPDGEHNALIHEVQQDPRTGQHLHADLFQVRMDEKIKAEVPLTFEGESAAVRELDGVLVTNLNEVEVECLPGDLPSEIVVSLEPLETFEDAITVAELKVAPGVEILNEAETNVVAVQPPKTEEQLEAELAEEEGETEEPEVEGEEGEEGEEGAEGEGEEGAAGEGEAAEGEGTGGGDDSDQSDDKKSDDKKSGDKGDQKKQ